MNSKTRALLISLMTAGLSASTLPGLCDASSPDGKFDPNSSDGANFIGQVALDELIAQAVRLHAKGYEEAVDVNLQKAKNGTYEHQYADALISFCGAIWTPQMSEKVTAKTDKLIQEAITIIEKMPEYESNRFHSLLKLEKYYRRQVRLTRLLPKWTILSPMRLNRTPCQLRQPKVVCVCLKYEPKTVILKRRKAMPASSMPKLTKKPLTTLIRWSCCSIKYRTIKTCKPNI